MRSERTDHRPRRRRPVGPGAGTALSTTSDWLWPLAWALLGLAVFVAYSNTFSVPLVLDDLNQIRDNASIRDLSRIGAVLNPPPDVCSAGRPLLNLTFALNYAVSGENLAAYHWTNLGIHLLSGLALCGVVSRTLAPRNRRGLPNSENPTAAIGGHAEVVSILVAALWLLHPLQTESVTYLSQRAESLMGLCYVMTLWAFVRSLTSATPVRWLMVSAVCCGWGMATKEVMVTAPVLVLLYDRTVVSGGFVAALRARPGYYSALAACWIGLGILMAATHISQRIEGYQGQFTTLTYAATECRAIVVYFERALLPVGLTFDYGSQIGPWQGITGWLAPVALVAAIACAIVLVIRRSLFGLCIAGFFLLLAPSSSVVPVQGQPIAESRMYLPLAFVVIAFVSGGVALLRARFWIPGICVAIGLGCLAYQRNQAYGSELALWRDTVEKQPDNARAWVSLGLARFRAHAPVSDTLAALTRATQLRPSYPGYWFELAVARSKYGQVEEAVSEWNQALKLKPDFIQAHVSLADALVAAGRIDEAIPHYEEALRLRPDNYVLHSNYGNVLSRMPGRMDDAVTEYRRALALQSNYPQAEYNWGFALLHFGQQPREAVPHFEAAIRMNPQFAEAYGELGLALATMPDRRADALANLRKALALNPGLTGPRQTLALLGEKQ